MKYCLEVNNYKRGDSVKLRLCLTNLTYTGPVLK